MMESNQVLHGKTVPTIFVKGYLDAIQRRLGWGILKRFAIEHEAFGAIKDRESLFPLYAYIYQDKRYGPCESLDYAFLAVLYQCINRYFSTKRQVYNQTRTIGRYWWYGRPYVYNSLDTVSLSFLFATPVAQQLNAWKCGAPGIDAANARPYYELVYLGVRTFVEALHQKSSVECRLHETATAIIVQIDDCPFCQDQSPWCGVFTGIVEGVISWLHRSLAPADALPICLSINEVASQSHAIQLDKSARTAAHEAVGSQQQRQPLTPSRVIQEYTDRLHEQLQQQQQRYDLLERERDTMQHERDTAQQQSVLWEAQATKLRQQLGELDAEIARLTAQIQRTQHG